MFKRNFASGNPVDDLINQFTEVFRLDIRGKAFFAFDNFLKLETWFELMRLQEITVSNLIVKRKFIPVVHRHKLELHLSGFKTVREIKWVCFDYKL